MPTVYPLDEIPPNRHGWPATDVDGGLMFLADLIGEKKFGGIPDGQEVYHIDGDPLNNQRDNLGLRNAFPLPSKEVRRLLNEAGDIHRRVVEICVEWEDATSWAYAIADRNLSGVLQVKTIVDENVDFDVVLDGDDNFSTILVNGEILNLDECVVYQNFAPDVMPPK